MKWLQNDSIMLESLPLTFNMKKILFLIQTLLICTMIKRKVNNLKLNKLHCSHLMDDDDDI